MKDNSMQLDSEFKQIEHNFESVHLPHEDSKEDLDSKPSDEEKIQLTSPS